MLSRNINMHHVCPKDIKTPKFTDLSLNLTKLTLETPSIRVKSKPYRKLHT